MIEIYSIESLPPVIALGNEGEKGATEIEFDVSAWETLYQGLAVATNPGVTDGLWLTYTRFGETAVYPEPASALSLATAGGITTLTWTPSEAVLDVDGQGSVVVHLTDTEVEKRSVVTATLVVAGHASAESAPEPLADYIEKWGSADGTVTESVPGTAPTVEITQDESGTHFAFDLPTNLTADASATTLDAGEDATASITQDGMGAHFAFGIPQGISAYTQAAAGGYSGSESDFNDDLASLETAVTDAQAAQSGAELAETHAETAQGLAEDARDSAQGYAEEAAASALQLASGVASPAGTFADLAALNAADPDHSKIYLTLDDGKWCYYNGSAFVAGGVYLTSGLAVRDDLLDGVAYVAKYLTSGGVIKDGVGNGYPNARSIYCAIANGKTYTLKVHGNHDRWYLGLCDNVADEQSVSLISSTQLNGFETVTFTNSGNKAYLFINTTLATAAEPGISLAEGVSAVLPGDQSALIIDSLKIPTRLCPTPFFDRIVPTENLFGGTYTTGVRFGGNAVDYTISVSATGVMAFLNVTPGFTYIITKTGGNRFRIGAFDHNPVFTGDDNVYELFLFDSGNTATVTIPAGHTILGIHVDDASTPPSALSVVRAPYYQMSESIIMPEGFYSAGSIANPWQDKHAVFIGDSIAYGYGLPNPSIEAFPVLVASALGMTQTNYGISSSAIAQKEASPEEKDPMCVRYADMADADIAVSIGGSNDWYHTFTPVGTMADRTNYTFYGALHVFCKGMALKYANKQVLFCTPIQRGSWGAVNGNGLTLREYCDIIKEVCAYYSIPVLDLNLESGIVTHDEDFSTLYCPDYTHPNAAGHAMIANRIAGFIRQLA